MGSSLAKSYWTFRGNANANLLSFCPGSFSVWAVPGAILFGSSLCETEGLGWYLELRRKVLIAGCVVVVQWVLLKLQAARAFSAGTSVSTVVAICFQVCGWILWEWKALLGQRSSCCYLNVVQRRVCPWKISEILLSWYRRFESRDLSDSALHLDWFGDRHGAFLLVRVDITIVWLFWWVLTVSRTKPSTFLACPIYVREVCGRALLCILALGDWQNGIPHVAGNEE